MVTQQKIDSNNYINFDQVKDLPTYRMKFIWNDEHTLEWTQSKNPISVKDVDFDPCANPFGCRMSSDYVKNVNFIGLSLSNTDKTLLDGVSGNRWWYAIGHRETHQGGQPAFMTSANGGKLSYNTKLLVWLEG